MELSQEDIAKIAQLSRLSFSDEELLRFTNNMNEVLKYASQIQEVDLKDVTPFFDAISDERGLRADEVTRLAGEESRESFFRNAPEKTEEYLKVKSVF